MSDEPEKTACLPVHLVESHGDGGHVTTHLTVDCPREGHVVSVDDCVVCPRCHGMMVAPDRSRPVVACELAADQALPRMPAATSGGPAAAPLLAGAEGLAGARVGEAMTRDVVCFRLDTPLDEVARVLLERRVSGAPVLDDENRLAGVISKSDLLLRRPSDTQVADLLSHLAFFLPESATLAQAAALMAYEGVHRIPVVSTERYVVGILSALDVMRWLARRAGLLAPAEPDPPVAPCPTPPGSARDLR